MYYNLEDPGIAGTGPDDGFWMIEPLANPIFDVPRNVPYMLEHSVTNILESADTSLLNQFKLNRYHISESYCGGAGNYWRNKYFVEKLREKGIRNSWGNPQIHENATHLYQFADVHATASLVKHWQTFNGTKISAPTLIDFSITELTGKNREIAVFNYGPGSLTINNVQITSSEFSITNLPSLPLTLQPVTDSLLFIINFLPTSYQSFADTAYIYSDDPITPIAKIILRGKGGCFKAEPEILYASTLTGLYTIDLDSFIVSNVGTYGADINYVRELNIDPATMDLYTLGNYWSTFYEMDKVNTKGGDGFWFQIFNCATSSITAAEIGRDTLLYIGSSNGNIYSIDYRFPYNYPSVNQIAATGLSLTAFAFSPMNAQLWAAVGTNQIYTIDISTGNTTLVGNTGLNKMIDDLTFNYQGILYGLLGSGNALDTLITINTLTGVATKIGALNTTALNAIAISQESPNGIIATSYLSPQQFYLLQNYPNPFNPSTKIKYSIPQSSQVQIKVFDILGNEIETLVNEEKSVGTYELTWNAANLPSGVYFYRIQAGDFMSTKKMVLLK